MRKLFGLAFLIGLGTAATATAQVRTFVSTSGVDNAACSRVSPCRTFGAALTAVAAGGEILALDSGGYGPFTINKSVAVIVPSDVHAAIAPVSGNAITVLAGASGQVTIRGLYLNSQGGLYGIDFGTGTDLRVESAVISGFNTGIRAQRSSPARVFINNTMIRHSTSSAFRSQGTGAIVATSISNSRFYNSTYGIDADGASTITVARSTIANASRGLLISDAESEVNFDESVISNHLIGIEITDGIVRLNKTTIADSDGWAIFHTGGTVETRQNNPITASFPGISGTLTAISGN